MKICTVWIQYPNGKYVRVSGQETVVNSWVDARAHICQSFERKFPNVDCYSFDHEQITSEKYRIIAYAGDVSGNHIATASAVVFDYS